MFMTNGQGSRGAPRFARDVAAVRVEAAGVVAAWVVAAWVVASLVLVGCGAPPSSVPGSSSAAVTGAASATPIGAAPSAAPSHLWEQARDGDGAALDALARAEGALGLGRALGDPDRAATARAALRLAPDGELALGALAERIAAAGDDAEAAGETLLVVLERPAVGERLDPEGDTRAVATLLAFAKDEQRPARLRALAISALRRLAARGQLEEATIPSALDEP